MFLTMTATVLHVFQTPKGTDNQGKEYGGLNKVQIQGWKYLKNGEQCLDHLTLTVDNPKIYRENIGKELAIPVGAFAPEKGTVKYFVLGEPLPLQNQTKTA